MENTRLGVKPTQGRRGEKPPPYTSLFLDPTMPEADIWDLSVSEPTHFASICKLSKFILVFWVRLV